MKKLFFGLVATAFFSVSGFASDIKFASNNNLEQTSISPVKKLETVVLKLESDNLTANYQFSKVQDFSNYSNLMIESFVSDLDEICTMTITMTVTVKADASLGVVGGSVSTTVTGSITCSCSEAIQAGQKLKAQLVAMAQS